jgi:methionyl-tRNA formyltransferase
MPDTHSSTTIDAGGERRLRVVFFGRRSSTSLSVLKSVAQRHRVVAVIESQPRGFQRRPAVHRWLRRSPAHENIEGFARKLALPFFLLTPDRIEALLRFLRPLAADVGVITRMAQFLPPSVIDAFPRGILNAHPSLLPAYRGPNPLFWAYYHQEPTAGITIHFIDVGEDTGDIVKQGEVPIAFGERVKKVEGRCAELASLLMTEALDEMARGTLKRQSQRTLPCPFRARNLAPGDNPIPWRDWPIERVYHTLRGADGFFDLLPHRPFPLNLMRWRIDSLEKRAGVAADPVIARSGTRYFVTHPEGRIYLRPRPSLSLARQALMKVL